VLGLTLHVADATQPERAAIEAWQASDEGRAFVRLASERWAAASIAAGTDPAEARAAETRVSDAYTGQPAA
jgi:hypothetical protein